MKLLRKMSRLKSEFLKRRLRNEEGQTLIFTALCMTMLLGFMALAMDVGLMFNARHRVQTAADAAAIAGAIELGYYGSTGSGTANNVAIAARRAAGLNGITDTTNQVAVNLSPTDGYHTGSGFVEVIVNQPNPTFFMGMFGHPTMNVGARAVGGIPPSATCMYILDNNPSDTDVLYTKKTITALNCGVQVNSPNPNAVCLHGSGTIDSDYLHIVGGLDTGGGCKASKNAPMQTGVAPVSDPFNNLEGPIPASACTTGSGGNTTSATSISSLSQLPTPKANPDGIPSDQVYCFSGTNVSLDGGSTALTLGPGIYVFEHGVTAGYVTINGGTLDSAGGVFSQTTGANSILTITAPTSGGIYDGIAIMQPSINTTTGSTPPTLSVQFGNSTQVLKGIIYAPTSVVTLHDNGGKDWTAGAIIAWQLTTTDNMTITDNYNYANPSTTPLKKITLVE